MGFFSYYLAFKKLAKKQEAPLAALNFDGFTNTIFICFIDKDNQIIGSSNNIVEITKAENKTQLIGQSFEEILNLDEATVEALMGKLATDGMVKELPFMVYDGENQSHRAWLSGVTIFGADKLYNGANIVIRARFPGRFPSNGFNNHETGITKHIFNRGGIQQIPFSNLYREYFSQCLKTLYSPTVRNAGEPVAKSMHSALTRQIRQNQWEAEIKADEIMISNKYDLKDLSEILIPLLKTARDYATGAASESLVSEALKNLERQMDESILLTATEYGLRAVES